MFDKLRSRWKRMSRGQKVKFVVDSVCELGCDLLFIALGQKAAGPNSSRFKRFCIGTATFGLGEAASKFACDELNGWVDVFVPDKPDAPDTDCTDEKEEVTADA